METEVESSEGWVYLIHLERPLHHAKHYLGSSTDVVGRMDAHRRGQGSRLLRAVNGAGIGYQVVRLWRYNSETQARRYEAQLKRQQHNGRLCPVCQRQDSIAPVQDHDVD